MPAWGGGSWWAAGVLGWAPAPELLDQVYRRSGGNPFFAMELARSPADAAAESAPEALAEAMPESLRDLLVDRVARLADPVARVVRLVAVAGGPVSHELLAAVAGMADDELLAAVRAATDAGVLRSGPDGYAPAHRLLREAILADLLPADRVRLHRAYAEALAADPSLLPPDRHAAAVAFHWYEAGVADRALPALLRAAEAAGRIYAQAEQAQMLDRALRLPVTGQPPDLDRISLYETAIAAATWAGDHVDALGLVDRALVEADRTRAPGRVALLLAHRGLLLQGLQRDGAATAVDEALALLPADRSVLRARVLDLAGAVLAVSGEPGRAHELAAEAAEIAEAHGEVGLATNARTTVGWALGQLSRYQEARDALRAARAAASGVPNPVGLARVDLNLADVEHRVGDYPAVIEVARRGLAEAEAAGLGRTIGGLLANQLVAALFATGRWDEADQAGRRAIERDPTGASGAELHAYLGQIALARGEPERAREHLSLARTLLDPAAGQAVPVAVLAAELALADNRLDQARRAVTEALPVPVAPFQRWPLLATAARVETLGGAVAGLREAVAQLPADTPLYQAYAAQVAAELGDKPEWPAVAQAWERLGCPYLAAQAQLRAAEASLRAGETGPARALLAGAAERARELGAAPLLEVARALARGARISLDGEAEPAAAEQLPLGLTEREAEVLRLIALGRSNREIGEALFISPKTVSVHVSNLLGKLGAANRGQTAAIAHRLRLLDDHPTHDNG